MAIAATNGIDAVLAALPRSCAVASNGEARLVVSPSGAFVLVAAGADPAASADRAGHLAGTTRANLADHVGWVPFIDAVVVTNGRTPATRPATRVPLDLLYEVLVEGPTVIDPEVLGTVSMLIDDGELSSWRPGLGADGAKIDLCQPTPDAATA